MKAFFLSVITPTDTLLEIPNCKKAQIQLADGGSIGILPGHAPLLAETAQAPIRYANNSGEHEAAFEAGILQIDQSGVTIFTCGWAARTETAVTNATIERQNVQLNRLAQTLHPRRNAQFEPYDSEHDA